MRSLTVRKTLWPLSMRLHAILDKFSMRMVTQKRPWRAFALAGQLDSRSWQLCLLLAFSKHARDKNRILADSDMLSATSRIDRFDRRSSYSWNNMSPIKFPSVDINVLFSGKLHRLYIFFASILIHYSALFVRQSSGIVSCPTRHQGLHTIQTENAATTCWV